VEGRKMSKSEGNFFTLRDLLLKGYKASAIRMLLISVPYRQQLNFTFEGLAAETAAVDRLRTFHQRIVTGARAAETNLELLTETENCRKAFRAGLENDLNTAEARAAIFDLVRAGNIASDSGAVSDENAAAILEALREFDLVFAVLEDRDAAITKFALDWAEQDGRLDQAAPEVLAQRGFTDEQVQALVDERTQAKRSRNFARADQIRNDLAVKGILIEDSKDGVRWRRK